MLLLGRGVPALDVPVVGLDALMGRRAGHAQSGGVVAAAGTATASATLERAVMLGVSGRGRGVVRDRHDRGAGTTGGATDGPEAALRATGVLALQTRRGVDRAQRRVALLEALARSELVLTLLQLAAWRVCREDAGCNYSLLRVRVWVCSVSYCAKIIDLLCVRRNKV